MAATVIVVSERQREIAAKVALDAEVGLLRVGVHEILALRISERLKAQWKKSRLRRICQIQVQIVLVEKDRLRKIQRLKLLLVGQVAQVRIGERKGRGRA